MIGIGFFSVLMSLGLVCTPSFAANNERTDFTCTIQVAKGSCWGNHTITIDMFIEGGDTKRVVLKPDEFSKKFEFNCEKRRTIYFTGSFSPYIWAGKENNKPYPSRERWLTPLSVPDNVRSWAVQVCFEKDFFNAPRPISDDASCECTYPKE